MHLKYCTYDQSQQLKKLGFDWYTESSFIGGEFVSYMGWKNSWKLNDPKHQFPRDDNGKLSRSVKPMLSCPSVTIVSKWLREEHKIFISINATCSQMNHHVIGYNYWVWDWNTADEWWSEPDNRPLGESSHKSYEECESDAVNIALNHLLLKNK